jgi:DNA glycosylase AlkZ-like
VAEDAESLTTARPSNTVRFLPGHDQWVMGPGTQDSHVTPPARREAITRKANPVIVGGVVRGTWAMKKDKKSKRNEIAVTWLDERQPPQAAVAEETLRLAAILRDTPAASLTLRW